MTLVDLSVIIPVFNCQRYLGEAIQSVVAQTQPPKEIIVVNDGSTDESAAVARSFPQVRLIEQENLGQAAARNHGVEEAVGTHLAFLDADDLWAVDKTALQMAKLNEDPSLDAVFGHAVEFRNDDPAVRSARGTRRDSQSIPAYLPSALLISRKAFDAVGGYSSEFEIGEALEWFARARDQRVRMATLDQIVLKRRIHGDNLGIRKRTMQTEYARVLKLVIDRRRKRSAR